MRTWWLHSTKFDGSLHYHYAVQEVERTTARMVTYAGPGQPVRSYRGTWVGNKHLLSIYRLGQPFVQHVRWGPDWLPEAFYIDIAAATRWTDTEVHYIDLDLDLIRQHGAAEVILDDADEFEQHRQAWAYPDALVRTCWDAVAQVRAQLQDGTPPFSDALFAWRPGAPLALP